jgi:hypothetical protein
MNSRFLKYGTLAVLLILTTDIAQAQNYATGFESPSNSTTATALVGIPNSLGGGTFTTVLGAAIASNDSWLTIYSPNATTGAQYQNAVNAAIIQSNVVRSGTQALMVSGAVANQDIFGAAKNITISSGRQRFDFDMRVSNANIQAGQWGFTVYNNLGDNIAGLGFYNGILVAGSGPSILYGVIPAEFTPIGYDTWARYSLTLDFDARTLSVALDGVDLSAFQNRALRNDGVNFTTGFYALAGQTPVGSPYATTPEIAYFDNFSRSIVAAPEPGTLALVCLGGIWVIVRRRKNNL